MRNDDVIMLCLWVAHIHYQKFANQSSSGEKSHVYDGCYFRLCVWHIVQDNFRLRLG